MEVQRSPFFVSTLTSANNLGENRKVLYRSMGSFSMLEDNIIAPTPRKLANVVGSPNSARKDKRKSSEESLFGEAGFEIQNILFQSLEMVTPTTHQRSSNAISTPNPASTSTVLNSTTVTTISNVPSKPVTQNILTMSAPIVIQTVSGVEDLSSPKLARATSPPLRASNPITLNSPFHLDEKIEQQLPQSRVPTVPRKIVQCKPSQKSKQLNRARSASWPNLTKISKKI